MTANVPFPVAGLPYFLLARNRRWDAAPPVAEAEDARLVEDAFSGHALVTVIVLEELDPISM